MTGDHLQMLKELREQSFAKIKEKFGVPETLIRAFFHYPPTYWHAHIHFCHTAITGKVSSQAGRAILLDDVIENLESDPAFYQKRALTMEVKEGT